MTELEVILDFKCCYCRHDLGVTLRCEGKGLEDEDNGFAFVSVPCPTCHSINQVYFRPNGEVARVMPYREARAVPVPCLN